MGFPSYDGLVQAIDAGKTVRTHYQKVGSAAAIIGYYSMWPFSGTTGTGLYTGAALESVQCTEATVGGVVHGGNVSTATKHLLRWLMTQCAPNGATSTPNYVMLYDRLLYYPGLDPVSVLDQPLTNSVALPRYTTGEGVRAWIEVTTAFGVTAGVFTFGSLGYTNSAGTGGRQHGVTVNTTASSEAARIPHSGNQANNNHNPFLPMQAGDLGVRSVQSVQWTTAHTTNGVAALVLGKPLAVIPLLNLNIPSERDFVFMDAALPRIYDGACLSFLVWNATTLTASGLWNGEMEFVWGG